MLSNANQSRIIRGFVLVELEILDLGIRNVAQEIRNPSSTNKESEIYCLESGIHSMESRIQDCLAFPYTNELLCRRQRTNSIFMGISDEIEVATVAILTERLP